MRSAVLSVFLLACAATPKPAPVPSAPVVVKPLDANAVATATGGTPEVAGEVVKVSFPRKDLGVTVDGYAMAPFMGLTSWAAFSPAAKNEAMVMGDLVLLADEVSPVMSALLDNGVEVTALHNHFAGDRPQVFFMHIGGEGTVSVLGRAVHLALDTIAKVRSNPVAPLPPPASNAIDAAKLDPLFGVKGTAKDGMYKVVLGRTAAAACGCKIGKVMGVNTWAAFGGTDDDSVVDGDFAVTEAELQPVLKSLRAGAVHVVAIHHHMTGESPRILFLHYWGRGKSTSLATLLRKTVDLTAWDRP